MDSHSPVIKKVIENAHHIINIIAANDDFIPPKQQKLD